MLGMILFGPGNVFVCFVLGQSEFIVCGDLKTNTQERKVIEDVNFQWESGDLTIAVCHNMIISWSLCVYEFDSIYYFKYGNNIL